MGPKSLCGCGHTGDGPHSEHAARFAEGHGPCKRCACKQFTWESWIEKRKGGSKMKTRLTAVLVAVALAGSSGAAAAEGRAPQGCTFAVVDALEQFDMTGKPRLYEGQVLRIIVAAEDGGNIDLPSATPEQDRLVEYFIALLCQGLDPFVILQPTTAPAPACVPGAVWYGCDPGINIRK